jgi:hypothetical protein
MLAYRYTTPDGKGYIFAPVRRAAHCELVGLVEWDFEDTRVDRDADMDLAWGDRAIQRGRLYSGTQARKAVSRQRAQGDTQ